MFIVYIHCIDYRLGLYGTHQLHKIIINKIKLNRERGKKTRKESVVSSFKPISNGKLNEMVCALCVVTNRDRQLSNLNGCIYLSTKLFSFILLSIDRKRYAMRDDTEQQWSGEFKIFIHSLHIGNNGLVAHITQIIFQSTTWIDYDCV